MPIFSSGYGSKSNPVGNDKILIADSEAANAIKGVTQDNLQKGFKGGLLGDTKYITASGNWTKPANLKYIEIEVIGGGGGGGGVQGAASGQGIAGGGGGGGYSKKKILAQDLAATESVTIGAGGNGAVAGNNAGQIGGTSSFGSHAYAEGGTGGQGVTNGAAVGGQSGVGGLGVNGNLNIRGKDGRYGLVLNSLRAIDGGGGDSPRGWGMGGAYNAGFANATGETGTGYGGGGSGASASTNNNLGGGRGTNGIVVVYEYY